MLKDATRVQQRLQSNTLSLVAVVDRMFPSIGDEVRRPDPAGWSTRFPGTDSMR
jgi:hypothetical protein